MALTVLYVLDSGTGSHPGGATLPEAFEVVETEEDHAHVDLHGPALGVGD